MALRIKGKGSVFQHVPVTGVLSAALLEWKGNQESFKGKRILAPGGIAFAGSQFVFAGYSGEPFSNRAFNLRLRAACRAIGVGRSPPTGCATARPPSSSTTWEKIFGRSRNYSATRIFGPPSATPTSATNKHGRLRRHSARRWSEVGNASFGVLLTGETWRAVR